MALSCDIKDRIFTFNGKDYNHNEFRALMYDGLLERVSELTAQAKDVLTEVAPAKPSGMIDASDMGAIEQLRQRSTGNTTSGSSKKSVIAAVVRAVNTISRFGLPVDVLVAEDDASYADLVAASNTKGKKPSIGGRAIFIPGNDAINGNPKIIINLARARDNDPAHEVVHAILNKYFGQNNALFIEFKDELTKIATDSGLNKVAKFLRGYKGASAGLQAEEFIVELASVVSEDAMAVRPQQRLTFFQKLANLINDIVFKALGKRPWAKIEPTEGDMIDFFRGVVSGLGGNELSVQRLDQLAAKIESKFPRKKEEAAFQKESTFAADEKAIEQGLGRGRDRTGRYQGGGIAPLEGTPVIEGATGPDPRLVEVARLYAEKAGIPYRRQAEYVDVDVDYAKRVADAYEAMEHTPQDPKVKEAYDDLIRQTRAQYDALVDEGYEFSFFDASTDPYEGNPWNAMRDLRQNKRMAVYGTYDGFGTKPMDVSDNPMLADTGLRWKDQNGVERAVTANDLFRAVHDAFGHGLEGAGFRARGEENAWQAHVRLFTGPAVAAITTETRGQNSWLNYGPYGEKNRTAKVDETIFADQKTGLMPSWTWEEMLAADQSEESSLRESKEEIATSKEEIKLKKLKDGSVIAIGEIQDIRNKIPSDVKGREVKGGIQFTSSVAPRVIAALEGRAVAYSRAGAVVKQMPMKDGKYVGAPEKYNTPAKITTLRKSLENLAKEGERGRYWYESSSRAILAMTKGNIEEAKKFVAILSIYSPQAKVDANSTFALRAWAQYKAGAPIKVKTGSQDAKATKAMQNIDAFWSGEKTGNFFFNLLREIDPSTAGKQGATIDMWMMRAGEYDNDAPTSTQYAFMENETNRIAQKLGWEPQQVQAAIWVAMKARMENSGVKKRTERISEQNGWIRFDYPLKKGKPTKTRVILNAQEHRNNWLRQAFKHSPTDADTGAAKFDFADGVRRHIGQISWEARPSISSGILPGIHSAPYEQQLEFQQDIQKALIEEDGSDRLAQLLGLLVDESDINLPGVWQGDVSPSKQMLVAMAPAAGEEGKKAVDPAQAKALNVYASIIGLITKQDGVGWHRPFYSAKKSEANGLDIDLGRPITQNEAQLLEAEIDKWMIDNGKGDAWFDQFAIISSPNGVRLLNLGIFGNDVLQKDIIKVAERALPDFEYRAFASDGDMPTNDWKENPNGESYIQGIGAAGRSDVLEWATTVLSPRVQKVYEEYSKKYGWGDTKGQAEAEESGLRESREIPDGADEDVSNVITVARRRLEKIQGDPARAEERDAIFGYEGAYRNDQEYRLAIDQGRDYVAELYFKYADLPPVEWAKAVYADVQSVTNEVSKVVAYGELHAALDMYAGSKKLSAKARKEIANLRAKMVMDMAIRARRMGQANAALNEVYSQYGKFAQLVIAQKIDLEFKGKLESKEGSEKGKTIADDIQQAKEDVEEFLDKEENKEIKEVVDLAEDVNDTMEDIHAAKVAAGESTPLDAPTPVSANELVGDPKIYDEIITELEDELKRVGLKLKQTTALYEKATENADKLTEKITELRKELDARNRLIGRLKKQKDKIAAERDTYKKQAAALEKKVNDLKSVNKLLAKNKLSPKQRASLIAKLTQLAGAGKLNDPDFDSVFAAITGGNYLTTQDRKAIEHMAKAMEYFAGLRYRIDDKSAIPAQKEMGEKYAKRMNQYLEQVSREPKSAQKWMMIFQSWFYNAVLSGISTLQNAFVGSILTGIPNAVMNSIALSAKNRGTAIGANIYGMMRMLKEMPTAFSKGMFNQSAYDSMGTSWTVESASTYADPFEVHILNGFFKQWDRVKNDPTALGKTKGALMLLASASAQATRVTALLKFIDPVLRHSLAAHMEGMQDYIKLKNEMRGMIKEGTADPSIVEAWTPFISKKLFNKIDEMAGVAMKDRAEAAKEAQEEIDQMESDGVSIPADYLRRRTSEIMRAKRDADMTNAIDQMSADMIMMWRPDGVLGYVWDKSSKKMAIRESDSFVSALGKLALNLSILPFLRITAQGVSEIQSTIPIIGLAAAKYGLAKKANGEWKWGSRTNNAENSEFANMQMGRRVALNVLSTMIIAGLFADTFEVEDADDDDEAEDVYDLFGKKVRIKMDPDRLFDFTSDARGSKSKNEGISEGRSNFSIRFRFGKDDEWSDWTSVRLSPHMTIPAAWLGRISDDVNKLYAEPVIGRGKIPKKAAFYEYFTDSPMTAMGEVSFATIPRLWSTAKYDAGAAMARAFMSPVAAIAQPAIYRDVIGTAASMAGATKKGEYMPEGFIGTSRALFSNIYGLNHVVSNEMTDEYGLPFESIDPVRNFWKNYTSIDERSDDYPEVNLRWKYANTFIAATPRAQRVEKVKRLLKDGEQLAGRSAEIELTKDEQYKSSLLTKAIYRNRVLQEYDNIIARAEQQKKTSGKNAAAAQSVEEQLNKAHRFAIGQSERAFATYKSGYIKIDTIVKTIESLNAKSKELSDKIKSKGLGPAAQDIEMYERRKK
jgi:hypothetical protein